MCLKIEEEVHERYLSLGHAELSGISILFFLF